MVVQPLSPVTLANPKVSVQNRRPQHQTLRFVPHTGLFLGNMGGVGILGVLGGLGILGGDGDWDDLKLICVKCSNPAAGGDSGCGIAVLNRK